MKHEGIRGTKVSLRKKNRVVFLCVLSDFVVKRLTAQSAEEVT